MSAPPPMASLEAHEIANGHTVVRTLTCACPITAGPREAPAVAVIWD
jgi:hypothetical protein